jgi:glycosyltransferase involved in cell wall biosynthesis
VGGVLIVFDGYPHHSGRFLIRDLSALAAAGVPVHAVTTRAFPRAEWSREALECPVQPETMPRLRALANDADLVRLVAGAPRRALRAARAFVAGLDGPGDRRFLQLRRAFWLAGEARRLGVAAIHATWALFPSVLAQAAGAASGLPYTISVHAHDVFVPTRGLAGRLAGAAAVFACNAAVAAAARRLGARDVIEIHHPLAASWLAWPDAGARAGRRRGPRRVVFSGRLVAIKGFDTMLAAFAQAVARGADLALDVAGDGEEAARVGRLPGEVRRRVTMHGWLDDDAYARLLDQGDVLAFPARRTDDGNADGIPNVVLEAFGAGLPVIAALAGSIGEALGDGARGTILGGDGEAGRVAALAEVLATFDPRADDVIGRARAAQRWVREHFAGTRAIGPMIARLRTLGA